MTQPLKGKTALITGSTRRGIGAATAMQLGLAGANIILNYGTGGTSAEAAERAESVRQKVESLGTKVVALAANLQIGRRREALIPTSRGPVRQCRYSGKQRVADCGVNRTSPPTPPTIGLRRSAPKSTAHFTAFAKPW